MIISIIRLTNWIELSCLLPCVWLFDGQTAAVCGCVEAFIMSSKRNNTRIRIKSTRLYSIVCRRNMNALNAFPVFCIPLPSCIRITEQWGHTSSNLTKRTGTIFNKVYGISLPHACCSTVRCSFDYGTLDWPAIAGRPAIGQSICTDIWTNSLTSYSTPKGPMAF